MPSIGIYPGTFDPIHEGHIAFAVTARETCALDEVILLPEATPHRKVDVTNIDARLDVIDDTVKNYSHLRTARLASPRFTVLDTMPEIRKLTDRVAITLLLGSDSFLTLTQWPDVKELLCEYNIAIGMRDGQSEHAVRAMIKTIEATYNTDITFTIIYTPYGNLASSQFRRASP